VQWQLKNPPLGGTKKVVCEPAWNISMADDNVKKALSGM